jgi:predicted  nucleic acid-binding Zn-ribbon protein
MKDEWVKKIVNDYNHTMLNREKEDLNQHKLANKRIEKLKQEKIRLTKAYTAGAMDLDILKAENDRINKDLAAAQNLTNSISAKTEVIEKRLMTAIEIAKKCGIGYKNGSEETKAKLNQALFKKLS